MRIADFDYELPEELIAQTPLEKRESSRMLVVNRAAKTWRDDSFANFPNFLEPGDAVVLNNTKVFPARLLGEKETGARVELFLIREIEDSVWETLSRPARRLKTGTKIFFGERLAAEVLEKTEAGHCFVKFAADGDFQEVLEEIGRTPLPPYIKREDGDAGKDRERYQTVYAKHRGSIAAPTAGLHFTPEILERIKDAGAQIAEITLHVGYGTFEPVRADDLSEHKVLPEQAEIGNETAEILNAAKANGKRIVAVGTTSVRTLESFAAADGTIESGRRLADLTITPGYEFKFADAMLTNFHLPQSSLLVLVSTFAGHELIMKAYAHAVASRYRFYSYGDCMLIV
jgi:S-adenosylmethionine:tRNA ribosyltransferase-isomerase